MLIRYRANGRIADVSEASGAQLVASRIAEPVEAEALTHEPESPHSTRTRRRRA